MAGSPGQRQAGAQMLERAYASQPDQSVAYLYAAALHSTDRSAQALEVVDAVMASGRRYEQMLELGLYAQALGDSTRMDRIAAVLRRRCERGLL